MEGFVKLFRKIIKWEWYKKSEMVHLFLHFLLLANHEDNKWQGQIVKKGQFITGLESLAENTGISRQTIRTCIDRLKSTGEITNKSTNKYRLITITNWEQYQPYGNKSTSRLTGKPTNNQQTTNKQLTANKNDKNVKNDKKKSHNLATQGVADEIHQIMDIFYKTINPALNWGNTTQRKAVQWLIDKAGISKAIKIVTYACSVQGQKYAPTITTPYQLKERFAELMIYYKKNNQPREVVKI